VQSVLSRAAALLTIAAALAGCGSSSSTSSAPGGSTASAPTPAIDELAAAEHPQASDFPGAGGRTLQQLGALAKSAVQLGPATGTFTPGTGRVAFGLNKSSGAFVYAPTAIYISTTPNSTASGPYLAPADPVTVARQYRSAQNTGPGGIKAIYSAQVPVPHAGLFTILALTRTPTGLIGAPGEINVTNSSPIPNVGSRPPAIATDTPASVHGKIALLTTRVPPDDMHAVSFNNALGKQPIALLFSTPQFCLSRVCGPVTDVVVSLEHQFASRIAFIHEEVYANNDPKQGFRTQMKAFHLATEPWLFVVDRKGVIVARLEGTFGVNEVTQALEAGLR
jgi:hypothetical protein